MNLIQFGKTITAEDNCSPNVGNGKRPTAAEMTYDKTADGYNWEGSFSDDSLKVPLKAKIVYKKEEQDKQNYRLDFQTEVRHV